MSDFHIEGIQLYNQAVLTYDQSGDFIKKIQRWITSTSRYDESLELFNKAKIRFELAHSYDDVVKCLHYIININTHRKDEHELYNSYKELSIAYFNLNNNDQFEDTINQTIKYARQTRQVSDCLIKKVEYYKKINDIEKWISETKTLLSHDILNKGKYYEELIFYYIDQYQFEDSFNLIEQYYNSTNVSEYNKIHIYYNLLKIVIDGDGYIVNTLQNKNSRFNLVNDLIDVYKNNDMDELRLCIKNNTKYSPLDPIEVKLCSGILNNIKQKELNKFS